MTTSTLARIGRYLRMTPTERRWTKTNAAAKNRGCPCGKPAEVATTNNQNIGRVPVEFWTCREHRGASLWRDGTPMWPHHDGPIAGLPTDCPDGLARAWQGRIGRPHDTYMCPHRTHQEPSHG